MTEKTEVVTGLVYTLPEAALAIRVTEKDLDYLVRKRRIGFYRNRREVPTFALHHLEAYLVSIEVTPPSAGPTGTADAPPPPEPPPSRPAAEALPRRARRHAPAPASRQA